MNPSDFLCDVLEQAVERENSYWNTKAEQITYIVKVSKF